MRRIVLPSALIACLLLAGCGETPTAVTTQTNTNLAANTSPASGVQSGADASNVGIVSSHGGAGNTTAAGGGSASTDKPPVATPELDAKIEKAVAKAKASGATAADKKGAAAAYMDRADYYWSAGEPRLYKFALGDYRRALRNDPGNEQAKERIDYLISIYNSMRKPVPDNGVEN